MTSIKLSFSGSRREYQVERSILFVVMKTLRYIQTIIEANVMETTQEIQLTLFFKILSRNEKSLTKYKQKKCLKCKLLWIFRWI